LLRATIHRSDHEMCGTGPIVGFIATGQAARSIEKILIQPLRTKRGLTATEVAAVQERIVTLRADAHKDMQAANV